MPSVFDFRLNMPRVSGPYDPSAAAWIALEEAAGYTFSATERTGTHTAFSRLRSNSLLTKLYRLQMLCLGTSAQNAICPIGTTTFNGGITHNAKGITYNGSSGFTNTGFIPSSGGWTANSMAYGYYLKTAVGADNTSFQGVVDGSAITWFSTRYSGLGTFADLGNAAVECRLQAASNGSVGLRSVLKTSTTTGSMTLYNGSQTVLASRTNMTFGTDIPTKAFYFGGLNNGGTADSFCAEEHSLEWIGGNGMTAADRDTLEIILYDWLNAFSVTPVLTLSDAPAFKVFQRTAGATAGSVTLRGGCHSTVTGVEARIKLASDDSTVVDWTSVDSSPNQSWSGAITVPQGGPYYAQVRTTTDPGTVVTGANGWCVGIVVVGYGQSNMSNFFLQSSSPPAASSGTGYFNGITWTAVPAANGVREFCNALKASTGVPVGILDAADPGVPISSLVQGTTSYNAMRAKIASATGGDAELYLWTQGESDATPTGSPTGAEYKTAFQGLHTAIAADIGRTRAQIPILISSLGGTTNAGQDDANWSKIQWALFQLHDPSNGVYFSHSNTDTVNDDVIHYNPVSQGRNGKRFAHTASYVKGAGGYTSAANWSIASASTTSGTVTRVTVAHTLGTDFTVGTDGWEASGDSGSSWVACTPARINATTIDLTHSSIATGATRRIRYLYGKFNSGTPSGVYDNSSLALPLNYSNGSITPV